MSEIWPAVTAGFTFLGTLTIIGKMLITHYFNQQEKLEKSRQETAHAQKDAMVQERRVYEMSLSNTIDHFNKTKAEVNGYRNDLRTFRETFYVEIQNLQNKYAGIEKELHRFNEIFKDFQTGAEKRVTILEDHIKKHYGNVILKDQ